MSAFASTLRQLRTDRMLSQSRLAERAGLDHSFVSRIESGSRMPSRDAVGDLATALGCSDPERYALLDAAGFGTPSNRPAFDLDMAKLHDCLQDERVSDEMRLALREGVKALLQVADAASAHPVFRVVRANRKELVG